MLEHRSLTVEQLVAEVAPKAGWGRGQVVAMVKKALEESEDLAVTVGDVRYTVPLERVKVFMERGKDDPAAEVKTPVYTPPVMPAKGTGRGKRKR